MPPNGYCLLTLSLPDIPIEELDIQKLPVDWQKFPPPDFLKNYGDSFVRKYDSVVLKVPSVILPNESNYLLNPNHPDFKLIEKISVQPLPIDSSL
jgi:RES domain-containing protein